MSDQIEISDAAKMAAQNEIRLETNYRFIKRPHKTGYHVQLLLNQEMEALRKQLAQEKIWKVEDPRMLREQIRVADVAFQHSHEQCAAKDKQIAELSLLPHICVQHTDSERKNIRCPVCADKTIADLTAELAQIMDDLHNEGIDRDLECERVAVFATPVMRTVARIDVPSTRHAITRERSLLLRRFIFCLSVKCCRHPFCEGLWFRGPHPCGLAMQGCADMDVSSCGLAVSRWTARLARLQFWRVRILQRGDVIGCFPVDYFFDCHIGVILI